MDSYYRDSHKKRGGDRSDFHTHGRERFRYNQQRRSEYNSGKFHSLSYVKSKKGFSQERQNGCLNLSFEFQGLSHFKEHPTVHPKPLHRPFHGLGCKCLPFSYKGIMSENTTQLGLRNLLNVSTMNSNNFYITRRCYYFFFCLNIRTHFNYPIISNKSIIQDDKVQEAMEQYVTEEMEGRDIDPGLEGREYSSLIGQQKRKAYHILNHMKASLSSVMIRITGYVLFKVFGQLFSSIIVTEGQLQMVKAASKRNLPLIFVPLHRSHVDYLLVTWVLFTRQIPAPLVAAGENLRIPIFGWLLRSLGGFFIKRKLESSKDRKGILYRSLLQTYVSKSLFSGYNLEFFIEGGRTRTGKPCIPKGGLLSIIVDAYVSGKLVDALIVPISINYDKLVDGNFSREQLGQSKVPESFWRAIIAIKNVLSTSFGHARIDFSQPFSLEQFIQKAKSCPPPLHSFEGGKVLSSDVNGVTQDDINSNRSHQRSLSTPSFMEDASNTGKVSLHPARSNSSLFGTEVTEEYRNFVTSLAQHIIYDGERCQAMMASNVVAWILSFWYRDGTTLSCLSAALAQVQDDLKQRGRDTGFSGNSLDVAIHAIKILGDSLIIVRGNLQADPTTVFVAPRTSIPNIINLNYYSNALLPLYALDAIIATSLIIISDCDISNYKDIDTDFLIPYSKLIEKSMQLCEILKNEFVFVPYCQKLDAKICESIDRLVLKGLLVMDESSSLAKNRHRMQSYEDDDYDDSSDSEGEEVWYKLSPKDSNVETVGLWTRALAPLIESYYATVCSLNCLIDRPLPEKEFISETQLLISALLDKGTLLYGECIAAENIKNALSSYQSDDIVEISTQSSVRLVCLNKNYESEEKLFPVIKKIEEFKL